MNRSVRSIIFDFDGVLADTFGMVSDIYDIILDELGIDRSKFPAYRDLFEADYTVTLAKLGIYSKEDIKRCVDIYYRETAKRKIVLFDDAVRVVKGLSSSNQLAIVSNTRRSVIENILKEYQLSEHFKYINGNEAGLKPDKKPYLMCLKGLDVEAKDTVFISDMDDDLAGAKAVGLKCVGATWGFQTRDKLKHADLLIDSPDEIMNLSNIEE
ncbi:HAD family hydrolase [Candidatus Woesearchaeota archaeon]|nr:HAD family hydrolase [Candidatus Woesearchaeota archaeon]